ncbi:MAG: hypothetical protein ABFS28_15990 [Bacteroidota bacterium]
MIRTNKRLLLLLPVLFSLTLASAQPKEASPRLKTYLTLEAGPQWSLLKVDDPGNLFDRGMVRSSIAGLSLGQEILPDLSLVAGAYYLPGRNGINMNDDRPHQSMWSHYNAYIGTLRAEYRIQATEYPFSFTPRLGYVFGLVQSGSAYQASGVLSAPDGTAYSYDLAESYTEDNLHMMELGIGLNLRLHGFWQASLNLSYLSGFTDPFSTAVDYSPDGSTTETATYTSKGNSLYTTLAFNIPVSNIWQNKDYRIRKRIENSTFKGKPTDKKGQFYVGAEAGSLWRQFNATNPAIGARPMTDRGLFTYANLHTGAYVGYMLSNEVGIDAGALYQSSSTFYAVMYDHQVNFVTKTTAPMYLEFPLRVRYFYNVYKGRIHLAVYGGASLLTQFSSGIHTQGGGAFTYMEPGSTSPVSASTTFEASRLANIRPILRMGAGMEYALPMNFPLIATLYMNYMHGFASTGQISVTNTVTESPASSLITYQGSGWSLDIGIKIPLKFGGEGICAPLPERK